MRWGFMLFYENICKTFRDGNDYSSKHCYLYKI